MYVQLTTLVVILWAVGESCGGLAPKRCCSPPQWEAEVEASGAAFKSTYQETKVKSRFSYDYPGKRWSYWRVVPNNETENVRLVYDHTKGVKYAVNGTGCYQTKLSGTMFRHCAEQNSTFDGRFTLGYGDNKLEYYLWSYDIFAFPLRTVSAYTKDCLPLQDAVYGLVQNTWAWEEGDPPCVPWADPVRMERRNCYKSHFKLKKEYMGTQITSHVTNMAYRNLRMQNSEYMFDVGDACVHVKEFTNEIFKFNDLWRTLIIRMKYF